MWASIMSVPISFLVGRKMFKNWTHFFNCLGFFLAKGWDPENVSSEESRGSAGRFLLFLFAVAGLVTSNYFLLKLLLKITANI